MKKKEASFLNQKVKRGDSPSRSIYWHRAARIESMLPIKTNLGQKNKHENRKNKKFSKIIFGNLVESNPSFDNFWSGLVGIKENLWVFIWEVSRVLPALHIAFDRHYNWLNTGWT